MRYFIRTVLLLVLVIPTANSGEHKNKKKGSKYFEKLDVNNDGKLSKEEWLIAQTRRFEKMDSNGDGFVTKEEKKLHKKTRKNKRKSKKGQS